ncbi:hypothetical protein E2562_021552 [Oryza meyeriana var. granulata]|uniref:MATH domain-containing protein n=1 Tax=Oryza meyeriana var. granulata TaxID=110450 RepID=A0A6G1EXX2_9ORYZ|nr:hypothetical protein E2562_021552 [Oryza meyeriana var. granulata]KAF0929450.1 hypothetical protein E2562_021552 [Oryza meyeriana var. granulata]KAF0929451.1 hypothetical protein E2562_021552 [Oryza meyeriana var. granulata]
MGNSCVTSAPVAPPVKIHDPVFLWKIYGFSALFQREALAAYSSTFHCSGYKWFLTVSPMYKNLGYGTPYVALGLALDRTSFKLGYTMNAMFVLSMYNHSKRNFLVFKASYKFDVKNTHSRKICLMSLENLLKSSEYLLDDTCVLGVEILQVDVCRSPKKKAVEVQKKFVSVQNLFLQKKEFTKGDYTWTMNNFLELDLKPSVSSPVFEIGGRKWFIRMYPRGDEYSTNSLSMSLLLHSSDELPPEPGMMIEVTLSILNQKHVPLYNLSGRVVFTEKNGWGCSNFIALKKFKDLVGSSCIVKADITIIGSSSESQIMV